MHSNPTHVDNFQFSLSALVGCHLEIKTIHIFRAGCYFLQKTIVKVLKKVFGRCKLLAADMRREDGRLKPWPNADNLDI
jgi:hypothetical protein